jgi:hypothetical protein
LLLLLLLPLLLLLLLLALTCLARSTSAPGLSILLIATMMGTSAAYKQAMHAAFAW